MMPKNKRERLVVSLSEKLPELTQSQRAYAMKHCVERMAYATERQAWCMECGKVFPISRDQFKKGQEVVCPHCGTSLKMEKSRKTVGKDSVYYTTLTHVKGFQVLRHYVVNASWRRYRPIEFAIDEVVQVWLDQQGEETVIARPTIGFGCYYWNVNAPLSLKKVHEWMRSSFNKYDIWAYVTYPFGGVLPIIRRNGYFAGLDSKADTSPYELMKSLLVDNFVEMLVKTKQYALVGYFHKHRGNLEFRHAINICNRNGYIVRDASMWVDYMELLEYFHLDTHNAHYVCPKDLKAEHDRLEEKRRKIEERREREEREKETLKHEAQYKRAKSKYFGICFGNEQIMVTVIKSVSEMIEEGHAMHHCVYTNGYYKKGNSLILSAKSLDGQRLETVEVNLKSFTVVQSRGVCNENSPFHEEIVELVKANMHLIRKCA